jgi:hypothetical protein
VTRTTQPDRMVTVPAHLLIVDRTDHGGYTAGVCAICRQPGWLFVGDASNGIKHKPGCPITREDER